MSCVPHWMFLIVLISTAAARCNRPQQPQRLRTTSNELTNDALQREQEQEQEQQQELPQLDLSQLSEKQLQQLMQQLQLADQLEEDHRGSSRPWNKVHRIIRRQLVRIPKRYLKKLLRQFGLARSGSMQLPPEVGVTPELYYLIPLE